MDQPVSCLIPAYNEAGTIATVLGVVRQHPAIGQIVVVDDGSKDDTAAQVRSVEGVELLINSKNLGKGGAVQRGLGEIKGEVLLMLDADLIDIRVEHVDCLLGPVLEHEGVTTLGVLTGHGHIGTELAMRVFPYLSGQRAIRVQDLKGLPDLGEVGYGIEMVLTKHIKDTGLTVLHVYLKGMRHLLKEEKMGFLAGSAHQFKMYRQVLKKMMELDTKPRDPLSLEMRREAEMAADDLARLMNKGLKFNQITDESRQWQEEVKSSFNKLKQLFKTRD